MRFGRAEFVRAHLKERLLHVRELARWILLEADEHAVQHVADVGVLDRVVGTDEVSATVIPRHGVGLKLPLQPEHTNLLKQQALVTNSLIDSLQPAHVVVRVRDLHQSASD
jgi:hypothetical protein